MTLHRLNLHGYHPPSAPAPFEMDFDGTRVRVASEGLRLELLVTERDGEAELTVSRLVSGGDPTLALLVSCEMLFGHFPLARVRVRDWPATEGLGSLAENPAGLTLSREEFFQFAAPWHARGDRPPLPEVWERTVERPHPRRPVEGPGCKYRRFIPSLGRTLSFRRLELATDLDRFYDWHHQPRVAAFWELARPRTELAEYLERGLRDPHQVPLILEFDGKAAGYVEVYWTREDRLGPYYASDPFDRGFHFLIGEKSCLGRDYTDAFLRSISHYMFLDEPRCRRLMAEPRADNVKVLRYVESFRAWRKIKEFDFPHKRAALLECRREDFFGGDGL